MVHTGQHYDARMSGWFFRELGIPRPAADLGVGGGSHAEQTAKIMMRFEPICRSWRPDVVVVVGDVNSTAACALTAVKLGIRVAHVEAGLRSFDRTMPEEINRVVTDAVADILFVTEPSGVTNLRREGIAAERIHLVGNVMIDTLLRFRARAQRSAILERLGVAARGYALVTLHRPANVDDERRLREMVGVLLAVADDLPVVFPVHPRTKGRLAGTGLLERLEGAANVRLTEPLGYLDFVKLMAEAAVVMTDSGGIQEETTILNVPCLTLRDNTERPVTLTEGTNRLAGTEPDSILSAFRSIMDDPPRASSPPALWDGKAAERIAAILTGGEVHAELRMTSAE
ncbi:MAG: UDP-N-acetylglucosamine 2-epimerase (non-hydrolyzing) [Planctomycetota bacterium]|nr:MAG: UDP-N-acetylglucosamine 2-epimerase (non-hydrolyzing) [Planctomycetota bacterium]